MMMFLVRMCRVLGLVLMISGFSAFILIMGWLWSMLGFSELFRVLFLPGYEIFVFWIHLTFVLLLLIGLLGVLLLKISTALQQRIHFSKSMGSARTPESG